MEEPAERKNATGGLATKEPLKTEGLVPSPDTSERSEGASSPPPNCSICLGKLRNTSFTDSCLHQFCFTCLLQWSKIKTECPLCKQTFKSIIHNVRSEEDYDQYHVPRELASQLPTQSIASLGVNFELVGGGSDQIQRFVYRTTMTPNRRYSMILNPEHVARREQIPNMMPSAVSREERRLRRADPVGYRRTVYERGEWSNFLPNVRGGSREWEFSGDFYRTHPHELDRLIPWINRELQILLNANESHIAYVLNVITEALSRYDIRGPEFRDTVRPYFGPYTNHFAHELLNYARTSFDLVGYDQYVTYPSRNRGLSNDYVGRVVSPVSPVSSVSSTSSDDSDVRVIDQTIDVSRTGVDVPSVGPHVIDMPGPSTVGETFQLPRMTSAPAILTISSSPSSSDECEVVGYVKPRHERTPEIIELASSDGGLEIGNSPDTSCPAPCESRDNENERAGPSHGERRRGTRNSRRLRRSSPPRWSTTSDSNTNDPSDSENVDRRRKKASDRPELHPRARRTTRKPIPENAIERKNSTRSRSDVRRRKPSSSTSPLEPNVRKNVQRGIRRNAETPKQLDLTETESMSESFVDNGSRSCSSSGSDRSSSGSDVVRCSPAKNSKCRKVQKKRSGIYSSSNSSSTSSSSVSSSGDSSSTSASAWSGGSTNRRRRRTRSRRKTIPRSSATGSTRSTAARRRQPVNATILRKDATNPNEWYVKKKSSRGKRHDRSTSSSSSTSSTSPTSGSSSSPRRAETELQNPARRIGIEEYRERRESIAVNPGCSRIPDRKESTTRTKGDAGIDSSASDVRSEATIGGNTRGSGISGRTRAKERSRHKSGTKRRKLRSGSSDSGRSRPVGGSSVRRRDQQSRSDQTKRKDQTSRGDRNRKRDRPSKSTDQMKKSDPAKKSDQANRNNRDRNTDQPGRDDGDKKNTGACKKHDQTRKNVDHDRKNVDHDRKSADRDRKTVDQERNDPDRDRKNGDQERNKIDSSQTGDQTKKFNDLASKSNGTRKKDHGRRNNDEDGDQAGNSKHSEIEKKSISKDKHKRKKKPKTKRRRSRSESKSTSRNSRHRAKRSSSYSAPATDCHDQ